MAGTRSVRIFVAHFFQALKAEALGLFRWNSTFTIVDERDGYLCLNANGRKLMLDRSTGVVRFNGRIVGSIRNIEEVQVRRFSTGDDSESWWSVGLALRGGHHLALGKTRDDVAASIAAARLGKITGKGVVARG